MIFLAVGLNHRTAPLEVREKLAVPSDRLEDVHSQARERLHRAVVLSTCNRTEVYTFGRQGTEESVRRFIQSYFQTSPDFIEPHLCVYKQEECVQHLFRVAAGLDSMVLGESEVLGQVRDAFAVASQAGAAKGPLSRLFHQALRVGKRVRRETGISRNALSVSRACVALVRRMVGNPEVARALVVGAGDAGVLAARALRDVGVYQIVVVNRTFERAQELAKNLGGEAVPFEDLSTQLLSADVVISCTGAPGYIITRTLVEDILPQRNHRTLFMADIAVPRDIEPSVKGLPGVNLYDIDDLESVSEANRREREREAKAAEEIVSREVASFMRWFHSMKVVPVIAALNQRAEEIRQRELSRTLKKLKSLSPEETERLDRMTRAMIKKFLHDPIAFLRQGRSPSDLQFTRELFNLRERDDGEER